MLPIDSAMPTLATSAIDDANERVEYPADVHADQIERHDDRKKQHDGIGRAPDERFAAGADDPRTASDEILPDDAEQVTEHDHGNCGEERGSVHRERRQCVADGGRREHAHRHHEAADQHAPERDAAHDRDGVGAEMQPAPPRRVDQRA